MILSKDDKFICNHYDWHEIKSTKGRKKIKVCEKNESRSSEYDWNEIKVVWLKWNWIIVIAIWILYECLSKNN